MKKLLLVSSLAMIAACSDGNNNGGAAQAAPEPAPTAPETTAAFEVSVVNLTVAQPLSPLAVVLHGPEYEAFRVGEPATAGLEQLAESGDNTELLAEVDGLVEASSAGPLGPGAAETFELETEAELPEDLRLTVVSMLVNTNDAITGVNGLSVASLAVGESMVVNGISYDSGTEANDELAEHIPGPAGGGEGFNADRDDIRDQVTLHPGVVSVDGGLSVSDLREVHRWDNPVVRITLTRVE